MPIGVAAHRPFPVFGTEQTRATDFANISARLSAPLKEEPL